MKTNLIFLILLTLISCSKTEKMKITIASVSVNEQEKGLEVLKINNFLGHPVVATFSRAFEENKRLYFPEGSVTFRAKDELRGVREFLPGDKEGDGSFNIDQFNQHFQGLIGAKLYPDKNQQGELLIDQSLMSRLSRNSHDKLKEDFCMRETMDWKSGQEHISEKRFQAILKAYSEGIGVVKYPDQFLFVLSVKVKKEGQEKMQNLRVEIHLKCTPSVE